MDAHETERLLLFTYNEHEVLSDVEDGAQAARALVEHARRQEWQPVSKPAHFVESCQESLQDTRAALEELFLEDQALPPEARGDLAEAIRLPFEKLAGWLAVEGWRFAGAHYQEFEGHHNDTELYVLVRR